MRSLFLHFFCFPLYFLNPILYFVPSVLFSFLLYMYIILRVLFVLEHAARDSLLFYSLKRFSFDTGQGEVRCLENRLSILGEGKHLSLCHLLFLFSSLFPSFSSSSFFSTFAESLFSRLYMTIKLPYD